MTCMPQIMQQVNIMVAERVIWLALNYETQV